MTLTSEEATPPGVAEPDSAPDAQNRQSLVAVGGFFALKAAIGFAILAVSAKRLSVAEFGSFSQLFLYLSLLGSIASAGVQNGVIREVAAAQGDRHREQTVVIGGLLIWACFSALVTVIALVFGNRIATVLVGNADISAAVAALTVIALLAGLGTLLCSALSGSGRAPTSLGIQGLGLVVGGILCVVRLRSGDGLGAVLCYALGPLIGALAALWASRHWLSVRDMAWHDARRAGIDLLRYSGTFLVVVSVLPLVLFGVRYVYRLQFGAELLGYWLLGNRVSDVTTQVVGLYLSQVYLPHATRSEPGAARMLQIRRTLLLCMGIAGAGAVVFAIGRNPILTFVLSERYRHAVPVILGYLVGDMFRVAENVALFTALAAKRLVLFVTIEVAMAALVGTTILLGIALGYPAAAYWGYLAAHATAFVIILLFLPRIARL
jgi:O-antigen/teichoic acid export membrane protein